jgi:hypothetical protein
MAAYEYRVEHRPAGTRMGPLNERIEGLTAEGWEPIMMTGDNELYIMMRRPRAASAEVKTAQAQEVVPISDED